jgi:Undecaprenyl-phosphate glucose phosphotransferase
VLILAIIISYVFKLKPYEKSSSPRPFMAGLADELARLTIVFGCAFFLVFVMVGLAPLGIWSCLVWGVTGCGLKAISFTLRRKYYPAFKERSLYVKNVAIICVNEHSAELARRVIQENNNIRIEGFFDDRKGRVNPDELPYPYLGTIDDLLEKGYNETLDQIIIALPGAAAERLDEIFEKVSILPLSIVMSPELAVLNRPRSLLQANSRLQFIQLDENPMIGWRRYTSAFIDIVGSSTALILFSPLFLIISILIKLESPGPVFYKQKRYGYNNKLFDCYKFRSMSQEACDSSEKEIKLTEREDPRVTRVGHFIRRTSLDEIPQFINVLKGDMSLIGPRPHPPGVRAGGRVYEEVIGDFARRYKVKPGLTGWAQVNGARGNTFTEEDLRTRFAYDLDYIQNWSLWLDIVIIMRTVFLGFTGKNAF